MSYDTYLTNQTNRHLDEQSRQTEEKCVACGDFKNSEDMYEASDNLVCEDCMVEWEQNNE